MTESEKHQLLKDTEQSVRVIETADKFTEYSKVYPQTNEDLISKYSEVSKYEYQNALTVLSSGDHLLNLLCNGINRIDTFDCNKITEYYVMGIKIPAILSMTYNQYREFMQKLIVNGVPKDELMAILKSSKEKYHCFWQEFYRSYKEENLKEFAMNNLFSSKYDRWYNNKYLVSELDYKKLQAELKSAKITFRHTDITTLSDVFANYDLIDISNILNYYAEIFKGYQNPGEERKKLVAKIVEINLASEGTIYYDYFLGRLRKNIVDPMRTINVPDTKGFGIECNDGYTLGLIKNKNSNL